MKSVSEKEQQILQALEKLGGRAFSKRIAETAKMSPQTASKYLLALEGKGIVNRDPSQLPHVHWEIAGRS